MALTNQEKNYSAFLKEVKSLIRQGHQKAAFAVNAALLNLYWNLGQSIAQQQSLFEGRNNYVEQLAKDLKAEFPEMTGFSKRNIFYFRKFFLFYSESSVQQVAALKTEQSKGEPVQQLAALFPILLSQVE